VNLEQAPVFRPGSRKVHFKMALMVEDYDLKIGVRKVSKN
jgi:hypothetical protein